MPADNPSAGLRDVQGLKDFLRSPAARIIPITQRYPMDSLSVAIVGNASSADLGTVQGAASMSVLKKALSAQSAGVAQLIASLTQPALATSGSLGTHVNSVA